MEETCGIVRLCEPALARNPTGLCVLNLTLPDRSGCQVLEKSWRLLVRLQKVFGALSQFQQAAGAG